MYSNLKYYISVSFYETQFLPECKFAVSQEFLGNQSKVRSQLRLLDTPPLSATAGAGVRCDRLLRLSVRRDPD